MNWRYDGFDAGIDYDCIKLKKGSKTIKCEWDNWTEWSIEGPQNLVEAIATRFQLPITQLSLD